ncbi:MAG TPA: cyclic nucleotide-binding domain-containing protein [Thermodesulfobacteriota bacterium]|nr:cyclic nucleotide-binding domain-containing protein [Thermodesulfobacteriota bacterium]
MTLKEAGQQAFSRREWKKALEYFRLHCSQVPEDLRSQLKMAELQQRLGQNKEAVQLYQKVAEAYAQDGFLLEAISIHKIILRIEPSSQHVSRRLAQLYAEKEGEKRENHPFPRIPLFSELDREEFQGLLQKVQMKTFSPDSVICREGEEGDSLFVITRGEVAISKRRPRGKDLWIRNLEEGDFFGEFGFFTDQRRHATVTALTESDVLEIHRGELDDLIKSHPHIKEVLQRLFRQRVLDLFIACSPLFSALTSGEREALFKRFRLHKVPEKTILFRGGDPSSSIFMIKGGEVEIYTENRQGRRSVLGTLKSGNFFGEIGVLLNRPRMAFARTMKASELLELSKKDLEAFALQHSDIRAAWKEISGRRLSETKELLSQKEIEKAREAMV